MRKKTIHVLIFISSMILLMSCGSSSNGSSSKSNNSQDFSIPKNIDMEIPPLLKSNSTEPIQKVESNVKVEGQSYLYEELKMSIDGLEKSKQSFKIDMLLASQLTEEITNRCQDIPFDTACVIDENELSFIYTETIIEEIIKLLGEKAREHISKMKNKKIPLGEVQFTRYSDEQKYQYLLSIEYLPDAKNITYTKESIKWSKDEKSILSFYSVKSAEYKGDMKFDFIEKEDKTKEMSMEGVFNVNMNDNNFNSNFKFKIVERGDTDKTFDISSSNIGSSSNNGNINKYSNSSIGHISNKGGSFLFSSNSEGSIESKGRETFDAEGKVISRSYCNVDSSCDLNDESTWLDSNGDIFMGGGPSSSVEPTEAPEILTQVLNLVGIPKSIVVNICQDSNLDGICGAGELFTKLTIKKDESVDNILRKVSLTEDGRYFVETYNPTTPILLELQDKSKVNFDDGKFTLNFNGFKIKETKELSILQSMVDLNIVSKAEADTFRTLTNQEAQDKFYTALLDSLESNINTFRNNGLDKQTTMNAIMKKMGDKIKVNQEQANKINGCNNNQTCVDKEIKNILNELVL